ncbi:hypothetical protein [Spiroplasma endosymbiont of Danaus chrysippus]|uniref:hypothetical protein n=1 Tax=Spiroplasma endosymbiont of Danaus chrysippus TaxID=2691041 RepID=UPI00157AEEEB|nr:hypothetical protein [Spiroplasma endosymbiont of Danaus chrysippus]
MKLFEKLFLNPISKVIEILILFIFLFPFLPLLMINSNFKNNFKKFKKEYKVLKLKQKISRSK